MQICSVLAPESKSVEADVFVFFFFEREKLHSYYGWQK